eukprot:8786116-Alexandrium_andersonii.AAC.1
MSMHGVGDAAQGEGVLDFAEERGEQTDVGEERCTIDVPGALQCTPGEALQIRWSATRKLWC